MKTIIIGQDDLARPSKSALLVGTEVDDAKVCSEFYKHKAEGFHPSGWPVMKLMSDKGVVSVAVARWKTKEEKAKALAAEVTQPKPAQLNQGKEKR